MNYKKYRWLLYSMLPASLRGFYLDKFFGLGCFQRVFENSETIFIHVPKSAGTSVSFSLYGKKIGHIPIENFEKYRPGFIRGKFIFSFVRNPWDRALSSYYFLRSGGNSIVSVSPVAHKFAMAYSFTEFLEMLLADRDLCSIDPVLMTQVSFLKNSNNKINLNFIGRVENFYDDISLLSNTVEFGEMKKLNSTFGDSTRYRDVYDIRQREIVEMIYKDDIEEFGYVF